MNASVAVIVVTHNRLELLKKNILSLKKQTRKVEKIVIINNGSTDGTKEWLSTQTGLIRIDQENVGGAGGFFTGIKYAYDEGFDWIWVMDDDVICDERALEELLISANNNEFGYLCSRVVGLNGISMNVPSIEKKNGENLYPTWDEYLSLSLVKVSDATFVSVLFPSKSIRKYGLPLKEMFIWGDDKEYTLRISSSETCVLVGKSLVYHHRKIQKSINIENEKDESRIKMLFFSIRNEIYISKTYSSRKNTLKLTLKYIVKIINSLFQANFRAIEIILKGIFEGYRFNPKRLYSNEN